MIKVERASVEGEVVFIHGTPYRSQPSCLVKEIILCSACVCMCGRQAMEGEVGVRRRTICCGEARCDEERRDDEGDVRLGRGGGDKWV